MQNINKKKFVENFKKEYAKAHGDPAFVIDFLKRILPIPHTTDLIIHSEMELIRCKQNGRIVWIAPSHGDVIIEAVISSVGVIHAKEFNGTEYNLDLKTGQPI